MIILIHKLSNMISKNSNYSLLETKLLNIITHQK